MPKVYRVLFDEKYQSLESVDKDAYRQARKGSWRFDGYPAEDTWTPLEVYVRQPTLDKPDIWAIADTIAFEPEAAIVVQLCLDQAGEQLKLPFDGRELVVLNVTYVIDVLGKEASEYDEDLPHMIDEYVFHGSRLDYSIFKIPQTQMSEILTVEGLSSPEEEFKPLVEKHNLKGRRFKVVYSW